MKLYSLTLSPFAARVRGAIYAKDLPIEIVDPPEDWRSSAAFQALNPLRRIPVLVLDDGTSLYESAVIVEFLEDAFPARSLRPADPAALARVRLITQIADLYVMQAMMPLFGLLSAAPRDGAAIDAQFAKLDDGLAQLDALLPAADYAVGGRLSMADLWLAPVRFTLDGIAAYAGRTGLLDRHGKVAAYAEVAKSDPALGRVWAELDAALKAYFATLAAPQP